jgi:hypothetical protein
VADGRAFFDGFSQFGWVKFGAALELWFVSGVTRSARRGSGAGTKAVAFLSLPMNLDSTSSGGKTTSANAWPWQAWTQVDEPGPEPSFAGLPATLLGKMTMSAREQMGGVDELTIHEQQQSQRR